MCRGVAFVRVRHIDAQLAGACRKINPARIAKKTGNVKIHTAMTGEGSGRGSEQEIMRNPKTKFKGKMKT